MNVEILARMRGTTLQKWKELMASTDLHPDSMPQKTVLVWDDDKLIASGSRDANILKLLAVNNERQGEDLLSKVLTELRKDAFEEGYNHLFLYTKPKNSLIFSSMFFYPIAQTDKVLFMENRKDGIKSFLDTLPENSTKGKTGALVMNCNPFTLGHRYIIEKAAEECDKVFVFVLSENGEGFSPKDRLEMVKRGTADLDNVTVLQTGPYLISSATFPTYFLKDRDSADEVLCEIDIEIFVRYFVPKLSITHRYVGTEPLSAMTNSYNEALRKHLPNAGIELVEIERKTVNGTPISASAVRAHIKDNDIKAIEDLVPMTTMNYLIENKLI